MGSAAPGINSLQVSGGCESIQSMGRRGGRGRFVFFSTKFCLPPKDGSRGLATHPALIVSGFLFFFSNVCHWNGSVGSFIGYRWTSQREACIFLGKESEKSILFAKPPQHNMSRLPEAVKHKIRNWAAERKQLRRVHLARPFLWTPPEEEKLSSNFPIYPCPHACCHSHIAANKRSSCIYNAPSTREGSDCNQN